MRICSVPGCPALIPKAGKCIEHARAADKARGTTTERGYGAKHRALRATWSRQVATGTVRCARCGQLIGAKEPWHLDHSDNDRAIYLGPSCARCNLSAGGKASHK